MHIARRAILVGCLILAGALIGDALQWLLPNDHLANARGAVGMVQGLVTLLLALVLGLLIWTSYGVYAQQLSETQTLGSQMLQLDLALERYGPGAQRGRELLCEELIATRNRFWDHGDGAAAGMSYAELRAELKSLDAFFASLTARDRRGARRPRLGPQLVRVGRRNALSHVASAQESGAERARRQRRLLVGPGLLLHWAWIDPERAHARHAGARGRFRRERHLPHPRIQPALFRPFQNPAGRGRPGRRRAFGPRSRIAARSRRAAEPRCGRVIGV